MSTTAINIANTGITMSNPLSGSGIDVSSVVSQIEAGERAPETAMQNQQATIQTQESDLTSINTDLSSLLTSVQALTDPLGALQSQTATSSDTSVLSATATSSAANSNHLITVTKLATTGSWYSNSLKDSTTATFTPGNLTITVGGTPTTLTFDSSHDTLSTAASYINSQNLGVTASVVTDSSGSRLALVSNQSGEAGDISVTSSPTGLSFSQGTAGIDAQLTVDGVPVDSASNTVTGAIPGVTLNLAGTDVGSQIQLSVAPNTDNITQAVNQFVSSYNTAIGDINAQFTYNSTTQTQGPLGSDGTLATVQSELLQLMTYTNSSNASFSSLASLGITMNDDGTLTVDNSTLSAAAQNNSSDLQTFMQSTNGFATTLQSSLTTLTDPAKGALTVDSNNLQSTYTDLQGQINDIETQITSQHSNLVTQYSALNALLEDYPSQLQQINEELGINTSSSS
ncbi:MAG: flagellar filament capping protein FliD [Candidatus Korobacteraceae bacterium]|jgi:flagellar hook-associated protein 2